MLFPLCTATYACVFFSLKKGYHYFFDPRDNTDATLDDAGTFEKHSKRYTDIAKLLVTLSGGIIAFLISILATDKQTPIVVKLIASVPIIAGFFGSSIALLIGFMVALAYFYEQYSHSARHNTYVRWKYATVISLGCTGVIAFLLGVGWLSQNLFSQ